MLNQRTKYKCKFCGYIWLSRIEPKVCPRCHNDWRNKPKNNGIRKPKTTA